ncbi:unnamed protein product [Hymenolepis diminuta]|uniref:IlGF domain-containing protein n=1 Tax=Hymenolepis diminuta TaxID=6216 RepID=A0A0R3SQ06_HYMDI|nr:unnamed protein product [Hymenolepis diminuta]VUZ40704.1 unnamed protein product [Hymenolepis diminuta]VUZ40708.1 unnamed protein product [Hymenolepis diminuta]VUZ52422.1 unnamed protein product [Hymenolepis diminuta]
MFPFEHCIPIFLVANIFFLISGGCGVTPFEEWNQELEPVKTATTEQPINVAKREEHRIIPITEDRPRILCGQAMIHALKEQCGDRGTFSPYNKRMARDLVAITRGIYGPDLTSKMSRNRLRKRFDDYCEVYLRYEPESPLSQCCCLGCTRAYLENFCAES